MTRNLAGVFCLVIDEHNDQHTDSGESVMTRQVTSSSKSNAENNNFVIDNLLAIIFLYAELFVINTFVLLLHFWRSLRV